MRPFVEILYDHVFFFFFFFLLLLRSNEAVKCCFDSLSCLTRGSKLWQNENTSRISQASGMKTNQDELARPPTMRFNMGPKTQDYLPVAKTVS